MLRRPSDPVTYSKEFCLDVMVLHQPRTALTRVIKIAALESEILSSSTVLLCDLGQMPNLSETFSQHL